jgi:signal transduction histidine kinase
MRLLNQKFSLSPTTVSAISFVLMVVIVAGIGFSGTAHVLNYLQERLVIHGIEHDREIASALLPNLEIVAANHPDDIPNRFIQEVKDFRTSGFRIFVIDRHTQSIIVDTEVPLASPLPIAESWLGNVTRIDGTRFDLLQEAGAARVISENNHLMLLWLQELDQPQLDGWVLGVANDHETLSGFMGDLYLHLDLVLLLTYLLITALGYFAMRGVGRSYERRLESQVLERTQALQAAHDEVLLKTRLATIGQTAAVLTHEMRNPLASIKLALSGLQGSGLGDREQRRVNLVLGEVDRLNSLLSETLDYVRPINLSLRPVDLFQLLSTIISQQQPIIKEKAIRIALKGCDDCTALHIDEAQIHQVFLNLIKNAIEATPTGGEISAIMRREEESLTVEITNGGDLLSEEVQIKAFDLFFTTKAKGTGLGLGLVKRVVEEHGGNVELISNQQVGTRVTMRFPLELLATEQKAFS